MTLKDTLILTLLAAIWGASFLFMRVTVTDLGAIALIQLRVSIGAACLLPVMLINYRHQLDPSKLAHITVVGLTNSALPFTLLAYATIHLSAGYTALLNSSVPLWSAIVAVLWFRDWLTRWQVLGLVLGFTGVFVLILGEGELTLSGPTLAIIASILATMSYGFSANYTKRHLSDVPAIIIATMSLITASVCMLPVTWHYWPDHPVKPASWIYVLLLGTLCTAFAYSLFYGLIKRVGPTKTVTVTFLVPAFSVFWGYIFLAESITTYMLTGCLIIFLGTSLTIGLLKPRAGKVTRSMK